MPYAYSMYRWSRSSCAYSASRCASNAACASRGVATAASGAGAGAARRNACRTRARRRCDSWNRGGLRAAYCGEPTDDAGAGLSRAASHWSGATTNTGAPPSARSSRRSSTLWPCNASDTGPLGGGATAHATEAHRQSMRCGERGGGVPGTTARRRA